MPFASSHTVHSLARTGVKSDRLERTVRFEPVYHSLPCGQYTVILTRVVLHFGRWALQLKVEPLAKSLNLCQQRLPQPQEASRAPRSERDREKSSVKYKDGKAGYGTKCSALYFTKYVFRFRQLRPDLCVLSYIKHLSWLANLMQPVHLHHSKQADRKGNMRESWSSCRKSNREAALLHCVAFSQFIV